jgi:hypothetical protein
MKWTRRPKQLVVKSDQVQAEAASKDFGSVWIRDLRLTWSLTILFSTLPAVLFGTGLFAIALLMLTVLIGLPAFAIRQVTSNKDRLKNLRKLLIVMGVPILTMIYVFKADARIPINASPIPQAIAAFKADTGHYPKSLDQLLPRYLTEIPQLKAVLIQPKIRYEFRDGVPSLSIPSSAGDAFAEYEYDFVNKTWIHHS